MCAKDKGGFLLNKKILFILFPALLLMIAGGVFGFIKFSPSKNTNVNKDKTAQKENTKKDRQKIYPIIEMKPFIVNLAGGTGSRYLKLDLRLEIDKEKTEEEIALRDPMIRDSILILLSSQTFSDISSAKGKMTLRKEITKRINGILTKGQVLQTYFAEFVVQ
ncbi:MAG: flagellar basal body-associated protein FliL [bacterium]